MPFGICQALGAIVLPLLIPHTMGSAFLRPTKFYSREIKKLLAIFIVTDNIIIAGSDENEQKTALHAVMHRTPVKFNAEKLQFKVPEVKYLGNILSKEEQRPDTSKVEEWPRRELRGYAWRDKVPLALHSKWVTHNRAHQKPATQRRRIELEPWTRTSMEQDRNYPHMQPSSDFLRCQQHCHDSSRCVSERIWACLLQDGKPVASVSRTPTSAEKGYAQIEKELLAIDRLSVQTIPSIPTSTETQQQKVETGHKPLEAILYAEAIDYCITTTATNDAVAATLSVRGMLPKGQGNTHSGRLISGQIGHSWRRRSSTGP